ncbi:50S ribosomal protein L32 [Dehalococcoides mccartyi]|uniref:Large ribosomal subunit protein bL32 n=1 Tax=Dehalococcoides mccartyi TaxID=61435 RepID=A0A0V8M2W5_9CHLR|nr:50S ribosomal protein L32 [Dehalococcoides mccartyi]KSV18068.1 50S ribosomal protein L32 [Dehalococcoides mccartyi]
MALPKRRLSHARQGNRRAHVALSAPAVMECPQCNSPKLSHQACSVCGTYNDRTVVDVDAIAKKKADKSKGQQ